MHAQDRFAARTRRALVLGLAGLSQAAAQKKIDCELKYRLAGWSAFYKTQRRGTITCDNGQSMRVGLTLKGGGITFGKTKIDDGRGKFSEVSNINDLLGGYAEAGAEPALSSPPSQGSHERHGHAALAGKARGGASGSPGEFTIREVARSIHFAGFGSRHDFCHVGSTGRGMRMIQLS